MSQRNFEAHITFEQMHEESVRSLGARHGWKFSRIDGDPVLGQKVYCYLSAHDSDVERLQDTMDLLANSAAATGTPPVRTKIELIVFDKRWK